MIGGLKQFASCLSLGLAMLAGLASSDLALAGYAETDLVSDVAGRAAFTDANLVNAWGMSYGPTTPFWVSNAGTGTSTLYDGDGVARPLVVTIPPAPGSPGPSAPTGQVFNGNNEFFLVPNGGAARFIFATEDGTIAGWNPAVNATGAITKVDNSAASAVYKGLALANNGSGNFLYASNFHAGKIDVFDSGFAPTALPGSFVDPNLPSGFAPFNIQQLSGKLYVTYAKQDAAGQDDVKGPGNGFVDVFDANGNFVRRLISQGVLNSPWGVAIAPVDFGTFSNALLVGNFGDGHINAFDPLTGDFLGELTKPSGDSLVIDGLWALMFGNGTAAGRTNELFFTAGPDDETHGLFGKISAVDAPPSLALFGAGIPFLLWTARRRRAS